ncbi:MAG: hypothetical protein WCK27_18650 [Verrucomicrobiota bacterium]
MMKSLRLIILTMLLAISSAVPIHAQDRAPLYLSITGAGSISPLTNGQSLAVGQGYNMVASPGAGFAFSSWQPVNVFTMTTFLVDTNGNTNTLVSVLGSPVPTFINQPSLDFVMQPVVVVVNNPGVSTLTRGSGWQANFEPVVLSLELGASAVVVTWTNSSYTLQSAPAPLGPYTNISGAMTPYTNDISGPAQYFRLVSQ